MARSSPSPRNDREEIGGENNGQAFRGRVLDADQRAVDLEAADLSKKIEAESAIQQPGPHRWSKSVEAGAAGAAAEEEAEEQTEFDVSQSAGEKNPG